MPEEGELRRTQTGEDKFVRRLTLLRVSNRTPLFTSSSLGFRIEIFRSKTGIKLEKEKKTHLENRAGWKFKKNFFKGSDLQRK